MNGLNIPELNIIIFEGNIIQFKTYPNVNWIAHKGYFKYEDKLMHGWYAKSVLDKQVIPIDETNMLDIVVTNKHNCIVSHSNCSSSNYKPYPGFIVVNSTVDRDELDKSKLIDGTVVKVNISDDNTTKYYFWDSNENKWLDEDFDVHVSKYFKDLAISDTEEFTVDRGPNGQLGGFRTGDLISKGTTLYDLIKKLLII